MMAVRASFRPVWFLAVATAAFVRAASAEGSTDCASVSASARLEAYGYSHVVILTNRCQTRVSCDVWTNVDPTPRVRLSAKPGEVVETVIRRGSPAHDVQAGKQCRVAG